MNTKSKVSLVLLLIGVSFVVLSMGADALGLDMTPGFGVFQTLGILAGISLLAAAGYIFLPSGRPSGRELSLMSDIGMRMGLTGLLACYVAGLADMIGVGTHQGIRYERPFFGPWQLGGFAIGLLIVGTGLLLYWLGPQLQNRD